MNETPRIDAWIVQALEADTGAGGLFAPGAELVTGVWSDQVPPLEELPAVRFAMLSATDLNTFNGYRVLAAGVYLVVVTVEGADYGPAVAAADRVDEVLHRGGGTVSPVAIVSCIREQAYRQPEIDGDTQFRHLGGIYRIQAHRE